MIYLNNAATSLYKPKEVLSEALNISPSIGRSSEISASAYCASALREKLLGFTNAISHDAVLTHGCTFALNQAIFGLAMQMKECDILVTQAEHNAVLRPVYALGKRGFGMVIAKTDEQGRITPEILLKALTPKVKIAVLTHAGNVTGGVNDIPALTKLLRSRGVFSVVDCAQSAGVIDVDLSYADMGAFPFHKGLHGLSGIGALIIRKGLRLTPLVYGGTGTLSQEKDMPDFPPERYEAGTHNIPALFASLSALKWHERYKKEIGGNLAISGEYIRSGLSVPGIKLLSDTNPCGICTFIAEKENFDSSVFATKLYEKGFIVRGGLHCAPLMHERLGTLNSGAIRVSVGIDTTLKQADAFIKAVKDVLKE